MHWLPSRRLPYVVKMHWFGLVLLGAPILLLAPALLLGGFRQLIGSGHPVIASLSVVFLGLSSLVFLNSLFESTVFSANEINYHYFFLIHRRFQYDELLGISRADNYYNQAVRFTFVAGRSLRVRLAYYDADYLIEVLKEKSTCDLRALERFRDDLIPPRMRVRC
jgi:hypothetical protein